MASKKTNEQYDEMYEKLMHYQEDEHTKNAKKLKIGIRLLWIIPLVFLVLLFITNSNKIIFLVLWIVSLFLISSYLLVVEYRDHTLQKSLNEISGNDDQEIDALLKPEERENRISNAVESAKERIESKVEGLKL